MTSRPFFTEPPSESFQKPEGVSTMPTPSSRLIPVTDTQGRVLLQGEDQEEPLPGSVVLTAGYHGTAWQRHNDGLWYSTVRGHKARGYTWNQILMRRNVVLIYDAEERD